MSIYFVQTEFDYRYPENGYGSYYDYFRLVELSGFPIIYPNEMDVADSSKCYIFTPLNGEFKGGWPDAKAKIIHWNLEQDCYPPLPGIAETWCSDVTLARLCNARYVFMGSHAGLAYKPLEQTEREYDVAFLAYITDRRKVAALALDARGIKRSPDTAWYEDRHNILLRSSAVLHIHQNDGKPYCAPQRWCLAAAYKLPLIFENLADKGIIPQSTVLCSDIENMPEFVHMWTRRNDWPILRDYGWALHSWLCRDYTFKMSVERNV